MSESINKQNFEFISIEHKTNTATSIEVDVFGSKIEINDHFYLQCLFMLLPMREALDRDLITLKVRVCRTTCGWTGT